MNKDKLQVCYDHTGRDIKHDNNTEQEWVSVIWDWVVNRNIWFHIKYKLGVFSSFYIKMNRLDKKRKPCLLRYLMLADYFSWMCSHDFRCNRYFVFFSVFLTIILIIAHASWMLLHLWFDHNLFVGTSDFALYWHGSHIFFLLGNGYKL